jgi:Flp pilus assembly protein TadB
VRINKSSNGTKRQKTNRQTIDSWYKGENKQIIKRDKKTKDKQTIVCLFVFCLFVLFYDLFILAFVSTFYRLSVCLFVFCLFVPFDDLFILTFVSTVYRLSVCLFKQDKKTKDKQTNKQTIDSRYKGENKQIIKQDKKKKDKQTNRQTIDSRYKGDCLSFVCLSVCLLSFCPVLWFVYSRLCIYCLSFVCLSV